MKDVHILLNIHQLFLWVLPPRKVGLHKIAHKIAHKVAHRIAHKIAHKVAHKVAHRWLRFHRG